MPEEKVEWSEILDLLEEGVAIVDTENTILRTNKAVSEIVGVPQEELIGKKCYQVFHNTNERIDECPMIRSIASKKSDTLEVFGPKLDRWLLFSTLPILDEKGKVKVIVHKVKDITERKSMEDAYDEWKTVDKMKEELISKRVPRTQNSAGGR